MILFFPVGVLYSVFVAPIKYVALLAHEIREVLL